ncbi:MAG: hypothetical protein KJN84_15710, partial [Bacteroidia bacterium]|nr:hypothetical protein [Bacteroidia bacterium]
MFLQDNLPAVITSPLSYNDPNPGTTRVNNISESGFDLSVQEWDYDDGVHNEEEISFFYAEPGAYNFGGLQAEIGFLDDVNHIFKSFEF